MGNSQQIKKENVLIELPDSDISKEYKKLDEQDLNRVEVDLNDKIYKEKYGTLDINKDNEEAVFIKINKIRCFLFYFKLYKWDITLFMVNFLAICVYMFSLESCGFISTNMCTDIRGMKWYFKIVSLAVISGIIEGIFIMLIFTKCKGYKHLLYNIPIFLLFFYLYDGTRVDEHGLYNSMIFTMGFLVTMTVLTYIFYFIYFVRKKSKISFIFVVVLIIIIIIRYKYKPYDLCENWTYNINSTMDNDSKDYPCKIDIPKKCSLDRLSGIVDVSKYIKSECHQPNIRKNEKQIFFDTIKNGKYFDNTVMKFKKFGYPITLTKEYDQKWITDNSFATFVNDKIIIMEYYENEKEKSEKYPNELPPEVILTFNDNGYGTITQKINFNAQLSEERKKISDNKKCLFKNIFMFYIDALSHKHFKRKLPKTANLFKEYFEYNENYSEKKFTAFEFNKYQSVTGFTVANIYAMNYGFPRGTTVKATEDGVSFLKYLKQNGYITGSAGTICSKDSVFADELDLPNVDYETYDHENVALFCDRNYYDTGYSLINGINSVIHRCLYGKEGYEYAFEYAELFWKEYADNNKFFRLHIYEAHELSLELIKYADDNIYNFLKKFIEKGYFDDTLLILVSDHGNNFNSYYSLFEGEDHSIEGMLPVFLALIPNKKIIYDSGLYENMHENQQTLITGYDIYNSIIHASLSDYNDIQKVPKSTFDKGGIYSWRGNSIFNMIDYKERYCTNPKLDIYPTKCVCL